MLCAKTLCTGCGACVNACPFDALSMQLDERGFWYPELDDSRCVKCGKCESACPILNPSKADKPDSPLGIFSAIYTDDDKALKRSSSGGISYALNKHMIEHDGVVFGAAYTENMVVKHVRSDNLSNLVRLQGSKYVQSDIALTFRETKRLLMAGQSVLYTGVGCQIAGLNSYLASTDTSRLITVDLLCGGGTSPGLFSRYISMLQNKYRMRITEYDFRSKKYGYGACLCVAVGDREKVLRGSDAGFIRTMGAGYVRESCFSCPYASPQRCSDITLGDFWRSSAPYGTWRKGVSLVFANTTRGLAFLRECEQEGLLLEQISVEEGLDLSAVALGRERVIPGDYDSFFRDVMRDDWASVYRRYLRAGSLKAELLDSVPAPLQLLILQVMRLVKRHGR